MCFKQGFLSPEWFWKKFLASRRRQRNAYAPIEADAGAKKRLPPLLSGAGASDRKTPKMGFWHWRYAFLWRQEKFFQHHSESGQS